MLMVSLNKQFRFKSPAFLRETIGGYTTRRLASSQREIDYFDPFNCEYRVYGRLKQENREDLAVRAHGYLLLTQEQEVAFTARRTRMWGKDYVPDYADDEKLNGSKYWNRQEEHRHLPVRAIVKDLCEGPGFTNFFRSPQLLDMWNDLEDLHRLGILVRDVTPDNYIAGKLVDFSQSWTVPTPCLEVIALAYLDDERQADPLGLQSAILDLGLSNSWKWGEVVIPKELQDCASGEGKGELDRFGADPTAYDWRKWEEDVEAADTFMEQELYAEKVSESEQVGV
jgi:serine/threonine protein kinase